MSRTEVLKTYKLYIGGKFPRTESGRYFQPENPAGEKLGNICLSSRKDFRNAVVAARGAQGGWSARTAYNRSQILYRIAEMMEGRKNQFVDELVLQGSKKKEAQEEVEQAIDRWVYYAGWCDKYQQVFSSVNPVASSHFNFSVYEPTGVVTVFAPETSGLIGLVSVIAPVICGGNSCIVLASANHPLTAITLAEVLHVSDLPGGVINILTGSVDELHTHIAGHMDVNALVYCGEDETIIKALQTGGTENVKRVGVHRNIDWASEAQQNPYMILNTQEVKTTWHPIEKIGGAKAGY